MPYDSILTTQLAGRTDRLVSERDSYVDIPYYPDSIDALRINRTMNRIEFTDKLDKKLSAADLKALLDGVV
jgi:hypothetical protein